MDAKLQELAHDIWFAAGYAKSALEGLERDLDRRRSRDGGDDAILDEAIARIRQARQVLECADMKEEK